MPKYLSKKDVYALYIDQVRPITYKNKSYIKLPWKAKDNQYTKRMYHLDIRNK